MELKEQIENIDWTIHHLLDLAGRDLENENLEATLSCLVGLNETKYELECLMDERALAKKK